MSDIPVYAEFDVDTRLALHLGLATWGIRCGGTEIGYKCRDLDTWLEVARHDLEKDQGRFYRKGRLVPLPNAWGGKDPRWNWDEGDDQLWSCVSEFLYMKGDYDLFLNTMANQCPKTLTFGWWLVSATARQKLEIADDFMHRHYGDPLKKIDWDHYSVLVSSDATK